MTDEPAADGITGTGEPHGPPGHAPDDLGTLLLGVYECFTDPEQYFRMSDLLVHWLDAEDPTTERLADLERHSQKVWDALQRQLKLESRDEMPVGAAIPDGFDPATAPDKLAALMDQMAAEDTQRLREWIATDRTGRPDLLVRIYDDGARPHAALVRVAEDGRIGLVRTPVHFDALVADLFRQNFKLSERELEVMGALVTGQSLSQIAGTQGKSVETVRSQVKSLASKLGARSQTEIIRMADTVSHAAVQSTGPARDRASADTNRIDLPDGRMIEYAVDGPGDGMVMVFFHCVTWGRHWSDRAHAIATQAGYRTIRISRAGFGASTPNKISGRALLMAHARDAARVLDAEGVTRCVVFAQGLGFPSAYQMGLLERDRVIGLVGLDIPPPILKREDARNLKGVFKTGALAALIAPTTAKLVAGFAGRFVSRRDGPDPANMVSAPGFDLGAHEDASGLEALRRNFFDAWAIGPDSYWREASYGVIDWAALPESANHRPATRLIQSLNSALVEPNGAAAFAERIQAPLRSIDSFLPMIAGPLPTVIEELEAIRAGQV